MEICSGGAASRGGGVTDSRPSGDRFFEKGGGCQTTGKAVIQSVRRLGVVGQLLTMRVFSICCRHLLITTNGRQCPSFAMCGGRAQAIFR